MKMFKGQIELKGNYKLKVSNGYFKVYDNKGNLIYLENSTGYWSKSEFDDRGNRIYYENSDGYIEDNRPKEVKEVTMTELEEKYGCKVKIVKEKE